ncbi:MAG: serine hydrolase domain-containing protein [Candidatus Thorarchaeota archaeon]|jgi:CubicO group peptidase (beta-lactamase class C family)
MIDYNLIESELYGKVVRRIRKRMQRYIETGPTPGGAMAVVTGDGSIWSEGFGYRDLAKSGEVDNQTIFQIGSTTKLFTALSFMLAVQDDLITLDDRLIDHWPEFSINSRHDPEEYEKIKFRHLLSHRAGLPREPPIGGNFGNEDVYTFEEAVESIKDCWMVAPVNDRYYYSNIGMDIVAFVMQLITGMKYPSWVKEKLGKPLGMKTLRLGSDEALTEQNVAIGTENGLWECEYGASVDYGCGDVWIGSADLAKVLVLLLNEGTYDGIEVLRKDLFQEIVKPHFVEDKGFNYGLGVDIYGGFNPRILAHGGGSIGYASTFYWIPEFDFGVSVLTNREDYAGVKKNPHTLGREARDTLLKVHNVTLTRKQPEDFLKEKVSAPKVKDLSRLAGFYAGLWNSTVSISLKDGKLYWHDRFEMTPKGYGFLLPSGNAVKFFFKRKNSRYPSSVTYVNPSWPAAELNLARVQPVTLESEGQTISPDLAEQITGIYKATYYGKEVTFNVAKVEGGQLFVQTMTGLTPAYPHSSTEGLFFMPKGETVILDGNEIWVENCRGVKWEDPVTDLRGLMKKELTNRLLNKWPLTQLANHLKTLGRKKEAKEVRVIKKELYPPKKKTAM